MQDMSEVEMLRLVTRSRVGHLGLAAGDRAYVVPLYFGFDGRRFYFHARSGLKDEYLKATKEACLVIDQVASEDDWASVMVFGRVTQVGDVKEQLAAMDALLSVPLPPEWGVTPRGEPRHKESGMQYLRLEPTSMTGRRSTPPGASREEREMALGGM